MTIAYLTSDRCVETQRVRAWEIEGWMTLDLKKLRVHCPESGIGRVTVKKGEAPIQSRDLIAGLRLVRDLGACLC